MIPFMMALAKEMTSPKKHRNFACEPVWKATQGAARFCVAKSWTAIEELAFQLRQAVSWPFAATFLPSPLTIIQIKNAQLSFCLLLKEVNDKIEVAIVGHRNKHGSSEWIISEFTQPILLSVESQSRTDLQSEKRLVAMGDIEVIHGTRISKWILLAILFCVNKRRILGSATFDPHRGMERRLKAAGLIGKFPLEAWTEIHLSLAEPKQAGKPRESRPSREVAFHWCRAHEGRRWGKLVKIKDCWKGNPALGIRRSHYRVGGRKNG